MMDTWERSWNHGVDGLATRSEVACVCATMDEWVGCLGRMSACFWQWRNICRFRAPGGNWLHQWVAWQREQGQGDTVDEAGLRGWTLKLSSRMKAKSCGSLGFVCCKVAWAGRR